MRIACAADLAVSQASGQGSDHHILITRVLPIQPSNRVTLSFHANLRQNHTTEKRHYFRKISIFLPARHASTILNCVKFIITEKSWRKGWRWAPNVPQPANQYSGENFAQDIVYDTTRIRRELGYQEPVGYEEGIRRSFAAVART